MTDQLRARGVDGLLWAGLCLFIAIGLGCSGSASPHHEDSSDLLRGVAARPSATSIHVVVEIPAGTNDKWEVDKETGVLRWEQKNGQPRVVQYLAYPGNYGMIPRTRLPATHGGDDDPLDVLLLGPAIERGQLVEARPIGVLRLRDGGELDDKIIAVPLTGPFADCRSIDALDERYPGVSTIISTWFGNYKGGGEITVLGYAPPSVALLSITTASRAYDRKPFVAPSGYRESGGDE